MGADGIARGIPVGSHLVYGVGVDAQARCAHWAAAVDVVAIALPCCGRFHACRDCHDAVQTHPAEVWDVTSAREHAILCGACAQTVTIGDYRRAHRCPHCEHPWNPRCELHHHLYFAGSDV